jgi:Protein of unknown function (DUF1573)
VSARRHVALLALLALAAAGRTWADAPPVPAAAPRIVVEPASFDFGTLRPAGEVQKEFVIRNHGRAELVIQSISTDCGCTAALSESKTVKPGGSTVLRVTLTAPAEPGKIRKRVLIKSNDAARPSLEIRITATVAGKAARGHLGPGPAGPVP